MSSQKIIVVEDDPVIQKGLMKALQSEGYDVHATDNGEDAIYLVKTLSPSLVLLDVMIPELNGFEVIAELRRLGNQVPIIVLSARVSAKDKVRGLDLGADDYVQKPFELEELLARIRRQIRQQTSKIDSFGRFTYDYAVQSLKGPKDAEVKLTQKERKLLELFLRSSGRIINREQILDAVWGGDYDGTDRTVDNLVVALRKKLDPDHILTERGEGYRFVTNP